MAAITELKAATTELDHLTLNYFEFYKSLPTYGKSKSGALTGEELWTYNKGLELYRRCEDAVLKRERLPPSAIELDEDRVREYEEDTNEIAFLEERAQELERRLKDVRARREDRIVRRAHRNEMYMRLIEEDTEIEINRIKASRS